MEKCKPLPQNLLPGYDRKDIFVTAVQTNCTATDTAPTDNGVSWADFWKQLEQVASGPKLDYTAFVYKAHDLDDPAKRSKFQQAVASDSNTSSNTVLSRTDFDSLLRQTSGRHLAEFVDLAMNMGKPYLHLPLSLCYGGGTTALHMITRHRTTGIAASFHTVCTCARAGLLLAARPSFTSVSL